MNGCDGCEYLTEDKTCGAFECNGIECPELPCEHYWVFTFGFGQEHAGKYVKIRGTYGQARMKMVEKYGNRWAFQYSEEEWNKYVSIGNAIETLLEVIDE